MMDLPPLLYCKYKGGDFFCIASDLDRHSVHILFAFVVRSMGLSIW